MKYKNIRDKINSTRYDFNLFITENRNIAASTLIIQKKNKLSDEE